MASEWHQKLAKEKEQIGFLVLPSFRPGKALDIEKRGYSDYISLLKEITGIVTSSLSGLLNALEKRLDFFIKCGCRVTDHSLEKKFFLPASKEQIEQIYIRALNKKAITEDEGAMYRGYLLTRLGEFYAKRNLVM